MGALALTACQSAGQEHAPTPTGATDAQPAPALAAADGRDYAACADGNCEVLVPGPVTLPLDGRAGFNELVIHRVEGTAIHFDLRGAESGASGSLSMGCISTFHSGGNGSSCSTAPRPAPEPVDGTLAMQLADARDGQVVLRLVSGEPGPPPASLFPRIPVFRPHMPFGDS
ncbi:hypothetical protein [Saccharopolyspora erythraea]|uniref:hypothetical protein n=1 Tax=Saccharopolyspora erythraea TaxID=1836 RepID=UPI002012847D|nr:hypothetical protein [Saccharopolyspora erythraea]